jgi:hypothetical protein
LCLLQYIPSIQLLSIEIVFCQLQPIRTAQYGRTHGIARHPRGPQWLGHCSRNLNGKVRQRTYAMRNPKLIRSHSPDMLLSASRDKTLIIWNLTRDETAYGYPKRSLHGHSHIVSDCVCLHGIIGNYLFLTAYKGYLIRRCLCTVFFLGQDSSSLGTLNGHHHSSVRRTHQRCPFSFFLRRQPTNRFRFARPHYQAMEHSWRLQIHHHGKGSYRVGVLCPIQPQSPKSCNCQRRLGQDC